jgi:hypothetical protein
MAMASQAIFAKYKIAAPPGYRGCLPRADHDRMVALCRDQSRVVTVKGLGAIQVGPGTPGCAYAELPVCESLGPKPPAAGAKPTPPVLAPMPAKPVQPPARVIPTPLAPGAPALRPVPTLVVVEPEGPRIVPVSGRAGLRTAGILAAAVVVGGGAYYVYRKRKARAS